MAFDALSDAVCRVSLCGSGDELEGGALNNPLPQVVENLEAQQGAG